MPDDVNGRRGNAVRGLKGCGLLYGGQLAVEIVQRSNLRVRRRVKLSELPANAPPHRVNMTLSKSPSNPSSSKRIASVLIGYRTNLPLRITQ